MPTVNDANGTPQRVTDNGFSLNYCPSMDMAAHAGDDGDAYVALYDTDPAGSDQDFFYMKNSSDSIMRIYKIRIYCTADVEILVQYGGTSPTNTTTVTPVNALIGSGNLADGDFYSRAGDLALTGASTLDRIMYDAASNTELVVDYSGEIAVEKNQTVSFNNVTDPNADIHMSVYFYYHEPIE